MNNPSLAELAALEGDREIGRPKKALDPSLRAEVSDNLHRLLEYRGLFGECFVGRQLHVCLLLLGGLAGEW